MGWICKCVANGGDRRGGEFYREELRERERETKNSSAGANGAYPHLFGLRLAENIFGRSLAEKASFGHRWAENGPVRPPGTRSYYFRPAPPPTTSFRPNRGRKAYFGHSLAENFLFGPLLADGLLVLRFLHSTL